MLMAKTGICGTMESNDCLITVTEGEGISVQINSIVYDFFGENILSVIMDTLKELGVDNVNVRCDDKGALDYTIKARLTTALARMEGKDA